MDCPGSDRSRTPAGKLQPSLPMLHTVGPNCARLDAKRQARTLQQVITADALLGEGHTLLLDAAIAKHNHQARAVLILRIGDPGRQHQHGD